MTETASAVTSHQVAVPLSSRVLVRSNLHLCLPPTPASQESASLFAEDLKEWQGTGVAVIAGGLLAAGVAQSPDEILRSYPVLTDAIDSFRQGPGRSLYLLNPGEELILSCSTAHGVEEVLVTCGSNPTSPVDDMKDVPWLEGSELVTNPSERRRFASSRALYRRLGTWLWIAPLLAIATGIITNIAAFETGIHRIIRNGRVSNEVTDAAWGQRILAITIAIVLVEALAVLVAALLARRAFSSGAPPLTDDDLTADLPGVVDLAAIDLARAQLSQGRIGTIVGGATEPSLTHLEPGFLAVPGSSSLVMRDHRGRLGFPPVFLPHQLDCAVLLETGAELYVALLATDRRLPTTHRLESLAAGTPSGTVPSSRSAERLCAGWPQGNVWPPPVDLATERGRASRVRRLTSFLIFLTGLLDLLRAVIPPFRGRLHALSGILPVGVSQAAGAAVAIIGICLVMLARGVLRGQRRAWAVAVVLLGASTILHLVHGINVGAAVLSGAVLILFLVERRFFKATTDRTSLIAALPALATIVLVAIGAAFLGVEIAGRHHDLPSWPLVVVAVSERLVGLSTVALPDRVDDFVYPVMVSVGIGVLLAVLYLATRPVVDRRLSTHARPETRKLAEARARDIVRRHGRGTLDYFALRDDKQFFLYGDSLVAYAVFGGVALVSPDPIGPESERTQVWAAFRNYADSQAWGVGVIGAGVEWLPIYSASKMRYLYIGDEAVVDVQSFSLEGGKMKGLRQACTRLERNGYTVEFLDPASIDPHRVPALIELMTKLRRGEGERGFSMMLGRLFDPKDHGLLLTLVCDADGTPAAMCQFVPSPAINGYSLDLMRRDPGDHPNGLLDYALCSTIAHLKARGATGLSLNFSAFRSTLDGERGDGLTQRIERWGLKKVSSMLPIETLWRFNEKYQPSWLARHLVFASPEIFVPVATAALRAESLTEIPIFGRFLAQDPSNRPGTVVPPEVLEAAGVSPRPSED